MGPSLGLLAIVLKEVTLCCIAYVFRYIDFPWRSRDVKAKQKDKKQKRSEVGGLKS